MLHLEHPVCCQKWYLEIMCTVYKHICSIRAIVIQYSIVSSLIYEIPIRSFPAVDVIKHLDTRALHLNTLLMTWMDYNSMYYIKYSQPGGMQSAVSYNINSIDCFQAWTQLRFYTTEQFNNQDSRYKNNMCFLSAVVFDIYGDCCSMFWQKLLPVLNVMPVLSSLHSGVTCIFYFLLFVSTLIFISMKDTDCQLYANINFVVGSVAPKFVSRGLVCMK